MKYLEFRMREVGFYPSATRPIHICWDGVEGRNLRGTLHRAYKSERAIRMGYDAETYDASTHTIQDFREYLGSSILIAMICEKIGFPITNHHGSR